MLPSGWKKSFSKSQNRDYYYNENLKKSVWSLNEIEQADSSSPQRSKRSADDSVDEDGSKKQKIENEVGRKVVIIVPFRDLHAAQKRKEHLDAFVPYMENFLKNTKGIDAYHILIVEQSDDKRKFNRGKLLNIGFKYARDMEIAFDSFIFHDVDLLPQPIIAEWYAKFPKQPLHIARCWGRYNDSPSYFGGIVAFSKESFETIDGFPTTYWGWGGEDDELEKRVKAEDMHIEAPSKYLPDAIVDMEHMDLKTKLNLLRKTDWKCNVKWEVRDEYVKYRDSRNDIPWWGLKGTEYSLLKSEALGAHSTKITVDVLGNKNEDGSEHWANNITSM